MLATVGTAQENVFSQKCWGVGPLKTFGDCEKMLATMNAKRKKNSLNWIRHWIHWVSNLGSVVHKQLEKQTRRPISVGNKTSPEQPWLTNIFAIKVISPGFSLTFPLHETFRQQQRYLGLRKITYGRYYI